MVLWRCSEIFAACPLRDTHHTFDKKSQDPSQTLARVECWYLCLTLGWKTLQWGWRATSCRNHSDTTPSLPQRNLGPTPAAGKRDVTAKADVTLMAAPGPSHQHRISLQGSVKQQKEHFQLGLVKEWRGKTSKLLHVQGQIAPSACGHCLPTALYLQAALAGNSQY